MSRKSKRHDNDLTFAEPVVFEEIPIEEAPVAIEEAKEEDIEKDNTFQEKLAEVFKAPQKSKRQGKVIFITRNGCVVEGLKGCKGNVRLFGAEFTQCEVGSVIEFD